MEMNIPKMKGTVCAAKVLAVLVVSCLIRHIDTFTVIFDDNPVSIVPSFIAALVLFSGLGAFAGLLQGYKWGFIPLYFFIPAATLFFDMSLLPFLPDLILPAFRSLVVLAINSTVLLYAVFLLLKMMDSNVILYPADQLSLNRYSKL
ncbi:hypothetical protein L4D76_21155 [Photobacterium sagamiensis]|uniref:hypothetical protein n=1 Tax=Photobacterium sagamiensis TaxID=2910241 RepID=UPI003D0F7E57